MVDHPNNETPLQVNALFHYCMLDKAYDKQSVALRELDCIEVLRSDFAGVPDCPRRMESQLSTQKPCQM